MTSNHEIIFCFSDLIDLFRKKQKWILGIGLVFSSICFAFFMIKKPVYEAKGSFIVAAEKNQHSSTANPLLLFMDLKEQPNTFQAYIKSKKIIKEVVEKLGLQISVSWEERSLFSKIFHRYQQNIYTMLTKPLKDSDFFSFENVKYSGEGSLAYFIRFSSEDTFAIFNEKKQFLQEGRLNQKIAFPSVEFTLSKIPKALKPNRFYLLKVTDFDSIYKEMEDKLVIKLDKSDKNVLHLFYQDTNRFLAASFINETMRAYQEYLRKEHEIFSDEQLHYLTKRKDQLSAQFQDSLDEYSKYLTDNIAHFGFMGIEEEAKVLMQPHQEYLKKHYENDLELAKMEVMQEISSKSLGLDTQLMGLHQAIQSLYREKDTLEIALASREKEPNIIALDAHLKKIEKVKKDRLKIHHLLTNMEKESFNRKEFMSAHPENIVFLWVEKLNNSSFQKKDVINYLKNTLKVLSVQEKVLNERVQHSDRIWQEFDGVDLKTAKQLYLSYSQKLDLTQETIQKINHAIAQLNDEQFEISSLGAVLDDSISANLIKKGSDLTFQLNDKKNRSDKDMTRIKEELFLIRMFLKEHLSELLYVQNLQEKNWKEKIYGLQTVSLDRVNQEISILNQQVTDYTQSKKIGLSQEKKLLEKKMKGLRDDMHTLPEKWKLEKKLKFQSGMALHMIESMMKLAESKTTSYHLSKIGSKPLDLATLPYLPVKKSIILWMILYFLLGTFLGYLKCFMKAAQEGFSASLNNLKALDQNIFGEVSDQCDGPNIAHICDRDFETLRNISHFIQSDSSQTIGLISGQGPNYGHCLASILGKCGKKTLLIDADFHRSFSKSNEIGLLQVIEDQKRECIKQLNGYDIMASGGKTRFGDELLRSPAFDKFMKHLKGKYDTILLFTRIGPTLSGTNTYVDFSDKIIISFEEETLKKLSSFFNKDKIGYVKILRSHLKFKDR